jgi:hypothetical protein
MITMKMTMIIMNKIIKQLFKFIFSVKSILIVYYFKNNILLLLKSIKQYK